MSIAITKDQLSLQIDRLVDVYGEKPFSEQRELMIWEAVEGLTYPQVIALVDQFIRSSVKPPLPQDFIEQARGYHRSEKRYALGEEQPNPLCADCRDSGFARAEFDGKSGWAPCHCDRGRQLIVAGKRMRSPTDFGRQLTRDEVRRANGEVL